MQKPLPEPVNTTDAPDEVVEEVGKTILDTTVEKNDIGEKPLDEPTKELKKDNPKTDIKEEKIAASYSLKDVVLAPIEKPQHTEQDNKAETKDPLVKTLVIVGVIIAVIGLLLLFVSLSLGAFIMFVGAVPIIYSVFAPIHATKKV